ncbi:hypothetical protein [Dyadobacter sp. BHUBP1]|uniref:hypothetical protein n=1 Tax=Dyadobacter sp. BHUBP1 TaxID=3424178 RepID=UPI003D3298C6
MERTVKNRSYKEVSWEDEDPKGPMMVWNGPRSKEDVEFMSNWAMARKIELEKEKAQSAGKTD